jgi:SAM-dependent methyltransferase
MRGLLDIVSLLTSYSPEKDHSFDDEFGTDTSGAVAVSDLGIADMRVRESAIRYLPSPAGVTRWMLENVDVDWHELSFVDLGCGKGRVLLVAAGYPFRKIVGVEISRALSDIARHNASIYRPASRKCRQIEVLNADVLTIEFPSTDLLIHFYHPFDVAVTRDVLTRLGASLGYKPRRVVLAYLAYSAALDSVQSVFAEFAWLQLVRHEGSVLGHYDWLFFVNG